MSLEYEHMRHEEGNAFMGRIVEFTQTGGSPSYPQHLLPLLRLAMRAATQWQKALWITLVLIKEQLSLAEGQ